VRREAAPVTYAHAPTHAPLVHTPAPLPAALAASVEAPVAVVDAIKSPMVGTCYLSPEPGAKPFASVGDKISEGDTLLIIEAMKVMNPITSPKGGKITQILIGDNQPVEFDQPLVVIE
jgi:acetyl-CoA carboxylase biotin carboxyl carrier protein